jgi:hypothetical protein
VRTVQADGGGPRTFRVTIRGRFSGLTDETRRYLRDALGDHDVFRSRFTAEGTLSYDQRLDFFNLRYEIRLREEPTEAHAARTAMAEAEAFLRTMRFGHRDLRAEVMDMSAMTRRGHAGR